MHRSLLPYRRVAISLSISLLLLPKLAGAGQLPKYPVADLPAALLENAHGVIRAYDETLLVKSVGRTVNTIHQAITILDGAGADWARKLVQYDQLNALSYLRGAVYDADGRLIRQLRAADVKDYGLSDGMSLATDNRGRLATLQQSAYPYTVEFDYEVVSDNPLFYSTWAPQDDEQLAVEQATFKVLTPKELPLRYQERHLPQGQQAARSQQGNLEVYEWAVRNLPAVEREADAPPLSELVPIVATAPTAFEVQGHAGSLTSWQQLGQWNYELNAGRDELPEAVRARVAALIQGETDERARIRKVYEFLQANTRYISIQLGLGGWQTFPANVVSANGYGDCKALSNYGKALLSAAGITGYCALVRADAPDIRTDFPSSQFNHMILCVPLTKAARPDTVWLECTSQTAPFNYMGSFTGNRHALLLTPQGGQLVRTPHYGAAENRRERRADVFLDATGSAKAAIRTLHTGQEQDRLSSVMDNLDPGQQKKLLTNSLTLGNFTIDKFSLTASRQQALPAVTETLDLTLPTFASVSGRRLFLAPNLLSRLPAAASPVGGRQTDVWLSHAYSYADTVRIHVPAGLRPENLPAPVQLSTPFGTYSMQVQTLPDGTLQYVRRLLMPRTRFAAAEYPGYVDFRRKISAADKAQVVLLKTDA